MDLFTKNLNELIVDVFNCVLKFEEKSIKYMQRHDLTVSELHVIECIGKGGKGGKTISDIAGNLSITLSSVTIAINKLLKKGYVKKVKSLEDGRVIYVILTKSGKKADEGHTEFHKNMINQMTENFTVTEKEILLSGMSKLRNYFRTQIRDNIAVEEE